MPGSQGALAPDQGLRLWLNIAPSEVAVSALPWEFLHDPDQGPLALLDAPIARYLPQSSRIPTLQSTLPLKVLLTGRTDTAAPGDRARASRGRRRAGRYVRACADRRRAAPDRR